MQQIPAVRRRKLGAELRRQRDLAGMTSGDAASRAGWHQSKVSRIETGRSGARPEDVACLLDIYGVRDRELRDLLATLAGKGTQRGWWHEFRDVLPPEYRDFISLETSACRARTMENSVVPGLLQTPGVRPRTHPVGPPGGRRTAGGRPGRGADGAAGGAGAGFPAGTARSSRRGGPTARSRRRRSHGGAVTAPRGSRRAAPDTAAGSSLHGGRTHRSYRIFRNFLVSAHCRSGRCCYRPFDE
ncbi:transcriptional regulator with XRE-family HTH domain [Streptomyces sp. SPB162]|nr:transcriptional regulator with XRE-family HTH domain [Streptomyces sp. SPB162]